jgi:hypothetical protein
MRPFYHTANSYLIKTMPPGVMVTVQDEYVRRYTETAMASEH